MHNKANDSAMIKSFFHQNRDRWSFKEFEKNDDKRY